tara:strand:+ start:11935 stop:12927 length:993 start_codon:yes stop_codon:yes gene_type:complete
MTHRIKIYFTLILYATCTLAFAAEDPDDNIDLFIDIQRKKGHSKDEIKEFLKPAKKNEAVLKAIRKPWERQPWYKYRTIFLTPERIQAGVKFWKKHKSVIQRAAKTYSVDAEIIVSIIGVETFFGRYMGEFNIRDALYTIGIHYPPRSRYFIKELSSYMELAHKGHVNPDTMVGSYAGAMGYGQFMPSSYLHYAVDFNNDGKIDLNTIDDAIGSVANYFNKHGWRYKDHVVVPAKASISDNRAVHLLWGSNPPRFTLGDWKKRGIEPDSKKKYKENKLALFFKLKESLKDQKYWLGFHNFYVISRYNHSQLYSMAAYLLSQEIKKAFYKQ